MTSSVGVAVRGAWVAACLFALGCAPEATGTAAGAGGQAGTGVAGAGMAGTGVAGSAGVGLAGSGGGAGSWAGTGGGGAGGESGSGLDTGNAGTTGCEAISRTAEAELGPVDIVWIIDASGSMDEEQAAVQMNITAFATAIEAAGIDHHVVLITDVDLAAGTTLGSNTQQYRFVQHDVGSHDLYDVAINRFHDGLLGPGYGTFLRPNAPTHFVMVTDDESAPMTAAQFRASMEGLLGHGFIQHAVASESVNGQPCSGGLCFGIPGIPCIPVGGGAADVGAQYYMLADQTGGQKISICESDWSMVFGPLQDAVVASVPLPCSFPMPTPPAGYTFDKDNVHFEHTAPGASTPSAWPRAQSVSECGTAIGWHFDNNDTPQSIVLCPAACDVASNGGNVNIVFACSPPPPLVVD